MTNFFEAKPISKSIQRVSLFAVALFLFWGDAAFAYKWEQCRRFVIGGAWFRKYEIAGPGSGFITTRKSSSMSTVRISTDWSTEASTISTDSGVWTKYTTAPSQWISSTGACSLLAFHQNLFDREIYIAENLEEIKTDLARGQGEHVNVLAYLSCEDGVASQFRNALRENFETLYEADNQAVFLSEEIDRITLSTPALKNRCIRAM